jgi:hypothetical protein
LADTAPVDCEPLNHLVPLQPPDAAQDVALVPDQLSVAEPPEFTLLGVALSVTVGAAGATVTVTDCVADPPGPLQVNAKSVVLVMVPVDTVPLVGMLPCHPPAALQLFASDEVQVSVELPPLITVVGVAVSVTEVGVGGRTATFTD